MTQSVNSSKFYSTTLFAFLERMILAGRLMAWPSLGSFREKPTSRCQKLLSSYTLTNTVRHRQDRLITMSVTLLSLPLFLLLISNMRVSPCSLGQQILSENMSFNKYINLPLKLKTVISVHQPMHDAHRRTQI